MPATRKTNVTYTPLYADIRNSTRKTAPARGDGKGSSRSPSGLCVLPHRRPLSRQQGSERPPRNAGVKGVWILCIR